MTGYICMFVISALVLVGIVTNAICKKRASDRGKSTKGISLILFCRFSALALLCCAFFVGLSLSIVG